jgi:hypothetical protein
LSKLSLTLHSQSTDFIGPAELPMKVALYLWRHDPSRIIHGPAWPTFPLHLPSKYQHTDRWIRLDILNDN